MATSLPGSSVQRPQRAVDPDVPPPAAGAAAAAFAALSRLRGRRIFHPHGIGYTATLTVTRAHAEYAGVPLLARTGEYPAVLRFSRALGLPAVLPDVLGLALRLVDAHGDGRHQDFVLVTSADAPVAHHLLLPAARGFFGQSYSSLLPYRLGGELRLVGAQPAHRPGRPARGTLREVREAASEDRVHLRLALAALSGTWSAVGDLRLGEQLPAEDTERLAFTPWNTGGSIRPTGPLMGLRRAAYRGSQRGRGVPEHEIP